MLEKQLTERVCSHGLCMAGEGKCNQDDGWKAGMRTT